MIIPEITLSADVIIKLLQHYHPGSHNFVHFVEHRNHVMRIASMELESEICRYKGKRRDQRCKLWIGTLQAAEMGESFEVRIEVGINKRINRS